MLCLRVLAGAQQFDPEKCPSKYTYLVSKIGACCDYIWPNVQNSPILGTKHVCSDYQIVELQLRLKFVTKVRKSSPEIVAIGMGAHSRDFTK